MKVIDLAVGSSVRIDRYGLGLLISAMARRGYQVIGPSIRDSAICYGTIQSLDDLPAGWTAEQSPGSYRLKRRTDAALFGYAAGPTSLKNFLHPAEIKFFEANRTDGAFRILPSTDDAPRYAFLGVRACELAAAGIQDRVLLKDRFSDPIYAARRRNAIIIAVHCTESAGTCFCASMGCGPRCDSGFDVALTECLDANSHDFLAEVGSELGAELLSESEYSEPTAELLEKSRAIARQAETRMARQLDTTGVYGSLERNFDHPHWDDIARRCLACGNCTMVCPTCFCITVEDTSDITGDHAERWRKWDSCFTLGFSYIHGGSVRQSTKSRYRQWLTHKLSYWHDQFGRSGCVGCGRCIAWCPAGIDLTQEVPAFESKEAPIDQP